ncbi:hypothetical protein M0R45_009938 [Rubus argutus]|uniref:DUF295 domain-containing protein n=1 Tax=Rubus argutus TaxID=59490 RepID=A0AAW1Y7X6_RUBAR
MHRYGEVDGEDNEVDGEGDEVDREGNEVDGEGVEDVTKYWRLSDCVIYKIDHECGNFVEIKNLGEGNSIYILRDGVMDIFCLDVGKVLTCPLHPEIGKAWFIPTLWYPSDLSISDAPPVARYSCLNV